MKFNVRSLTLRVFFFFLLFTSHYSLFSVSYAAHPLITDDTGSQGKGKFALEVNSELSSDKETEEGVAAKQTGGEVAAIISYGLINTADIVLGMPYQWFKIKEDGEETSKESGISDISLELKWRFYEKDGFSFALKPGLSLPTGDDEKGLGAGRLTYSMFFIATKAVGPWSFHANLGYIRNENKADERKNLWHASLATTVEVIKDLSLVGNIGIERNTDRNLNIHPAFILGGIIYSITENFDIDFGIKGGLNKLETDYSVLAGMAIRF